MADPALRRIDYLVGHARPDIDLLFGIFLLKRHGARGGYDAASARLHFGEPAPRIREFLDQGQALTLDTFGGDFDEHGPDDRGFCAAELVARALGIQKDPGIQPLLRAVSLNNRGRHAVEYRNPLLKRFNLFSVMPILGWYSQEDPVALYGLSRRIFDGMIQLFEKPSIRVGTRLEKFLEQYLEEHPENKEWLEKLSELSRKRIPLPKRELEIFSIKGVIKALEMRTRPDDLPRLTGFIFSAIAAWEREWPKALEEAAQFEVMTLEGGVKIASGSYISERTPQALRHTVGPHVAVSRHAQTRITGIVCYDKRISLLDTGVAEAVRRREAELRNEETTDEGLRQVGGTTSHAWYLDNRGHTMLLCGSRVMPPPEGPSLIPLPELTEIVKESLYREYVLKESLKELQEHFSGR